MQDHVVAAFLGSGYDRLRVVFLRVAVRVQRIDRLRGFADDNQHFVHDSSLSFLRLLETSPVMLAERPND